MKDKEKDAEKKKKDRDYRRHVFLYKFCWIFVGPIICLIKHFKAQRIPKIQGPALILCNHNADLDPFFVGIASPFRHMYYVASEHLFRRGLGSRLMAWAAGPIARMKGSTDGSAAMSVLRHLKEGHDVCIFAEGCCSYNGKTGPIHPTVGRLAKISGATLVDYRITGAYMQKPRWGMTTRWGPIRGQLANIYPPEKLKTMTNAQVNEAIRQDLFSNAYDLQREKPVRYGGNRRAEALETSLYLCPKCHRFSTLHSKGNRFWCDCGLDLTVDNFGFFQPNGADPAPFDAVDKWDEWQTKEMETLLSSGEPIAFRDREAVLRRIGEEHTDVVVDQGDIAMDRERLTIGSTEFPLEAVQDLTLCRKNLIVFTANDEHYEVRTETTYNARKYLAVYEWLRDHRKKEK